MEDVFRQHDHHIHLEPSSERIPRASRRPFVSGPAEFGKVRVDSVSGLRDPTVHADGHVRRAARCALEPPQLQDHLLPLAIHDAQMVESDRGALGGGAERNDRLLDDILHRRLQTVGQRPDQVSRSDVLRDWAVQRGRNFMVPNAGEQRAIVVPRS